LLQAYRALTARTAPIPGATVENNKFCLSVHFRCVQEEVRICDLPWVSVMLCAPPITCMAEADMYV
jgi:hypothetical protein